MTDRWTITLMGENQSLILETLSDIIAQYQGNWLDSRLAQMDGKFVGIVSASIPKSHSGKLQDELESFADSRDIVMLVTINGHTKKDNIPLFKIKITAHDRKGIVLSISKILRQQALNVREFNTHCDSAPFAGQQLFTAELVLEISEKEKDILLQSIEALGDDFMVDTENLSLD
ncbi:MAG TPA: hypothetical protein ENJ60_13575 [Aeromonadales bacterium]|nr:hypothetical protein [Aeromonadales bacterium]